jgi:GNAT superfamily N-acetyltransferase
VLVTGADVGDEPSYGPALERAGYELRVREPEHRMFRTPAHDVHVHVWGDGDPEIDRYLVFRDRLRASPDDRSEYERLKRSLAQREWSDMNHYADAKGPVIEAILARARQSHIRPARSTDAGAVAGLLGALGYPTGADAAATQLEPALAVRADRRRQGVARALLEAVEAIARGRACFRLELTTRPDRDDALRFYEACGFAERPRRLVKPL